MNKVQRQAAFNYAHVLVSKYAAPGIELDADVDSDQGFDEVEDGVWVHAWIKVPKEAIPNYSMTPPATAATVSVRPPKEWPFPSSHTHLNINNQE
jgi:hypothetical protein